MAAIVNIFQETSSAVFERDTEELFSTLINFSERKIVGHRGDPTAPTWWPASDRFAGSGGRIPLGGTPLFAVN
jgi:hypothetical protein